MFRSEVSDGVVSQVGRSKDHIVGPAVPISADVKTKKGFSANHANIKAMVTHPFSPLLITEGSVRISPTPTHTDKHTQT